MKTVEGVTISGYDEEVLAEDLERYCDASSIARDHLGTAKEAGVSIETFEDGHICHADGAVVKISMDACIDAKTGTTSRPYLTESVLFEIQNAINARRYGGLSADVRGGRISILQYGLNLAKLEFESTEKVVQILTQIKAQGMPLSPWGEKQFEGYAKGATFAANEPHDPNGAAEMRMPSKLMYAYNYLVNDVKYVRNMKLQVLQKLATFKKGRQSMPSFDWSRMRADWGSTYSAVPPAQFLVCYIDALQWLGNETGWTVTWEGGTASEWKLCAEKFVQSVPTVTHDAGLTKKLKTEIMAGNFR